MCDGMRMDRRLILIGVMLVVLSMTMATQYATTRVQYTFGIVHPSEADIRYIGSDNSSDNTRVLRISNNGTGSQYATIDLGSWMPNSQKNYTAAFGIVNEEQFPVNITHVNISGTNATYLTIWLHGSRTADYTGESASMVKVWDSNGARFSSTDVAWTLSAGDGVVTSMNYSGSELINTPWDYDGTSNVRYSETDVAAVNETNDFVWVGISLNLPTDAGSGTTPTGTIYIHFKSVPT
jgi:hypothetical protein